MNPTVGDLARNAAKIIEMYGKAASTTDAEIVVFPECALTGYPLDDLVLRQSFLDAVHDAIYDIKEAVRRVPDGPVLIYGSPLKDRDGIRNAAIIEDPKERDSGIVYTTKTELPNYGVFDEKRHFVPNHDPQPVTIRGRKIGLMICEDCWFPIVSRKLSARGAELLIAINGSPFEMGKNVVRENIVRDRITETGLPFVYVNLVGGQDELVFDGGSFAHEGIGIVQSAPYFKEGITVFEVATKPGSFCVAEILARVCPTPHPSGIAEVYDAVVLGTRDYLLKQGFTSVVLGYSGGVDSGIVASIAVDAIGRGNVYLVRLPSRFSSEGSLKDAHDGAFRLGVLGNMRTIHIEQAVDALRVAHEASAHRPLTGVADENIQARVRGNTLMAISNQEGHMLLTTGNKSEVSVGFSTLYGDMSGGFNPIKDCYKTTVWEMCRWRNSLSAHELVERGYLGPSGEIIPESIISKQPSAELREDQKDEDSLPPYPVLDSILKLLIEKDLGVEEVVSLGFDRDVVIRVRYLIDNAEYKRRQAAPGVKITTKIHGRDRRYPIVNRWRG